MRTRFRALALLFGVTIGLSGFLATARATTTSTLQPNRLPSDNQPSQSQQRVERDAPRAGELFRSGTASLAAGNFSAAEVDLRKAFEIAPEQPDIVRNLAWSITESKPEEALMLARSAVRLQRSPDNLFALANMQLLPSENSDQQPTNPSFGLKVAETNLEEARLLLTQEVPIPEAFLTAIDEMGVQVAIQLEEIFLISKWNQRLLISTPNSKEGHVIAVSVARAYKDKVTEERERLIALSLGATEEELKPPTAPARQPITNSPIVRIALLTLGLFLAMALLVGLFLLTGMFVTRKTIKFVRDSDPNLDSSDELPLRRLHGALTRMSGTIYAMVLPIMMTISFILVMAISAVLLVLRRIPLGVFGSIFDGIHAAATTFWAQISRRWSSGERPGFALAPLEASDLYQLLNETARIVQTDPPDEVRLVPLADMFVFEDRTAVGRERVLVIGASTLLGMDREAFSAVLAHELGHFRGGDTSSGVSARRVTNNMMALSTALPSGMFSYLLSNQLRVFWAIHHRVTAGTTRFQETVADRVAARAYGSAAFERGLRHVIRRQFESESAIKELVQRSGTAKSFVSVYSPELIANLSITLDAQIEAEITAPASIFSTHPSPVDRFTDTSRIRPRSVPELEAHASAWSLFEDPAGLIQKSEEHLRTHMDLDNAWPTGGGALPDREFYESLLAAANAE